MQGKAVDLEKWYFRGRKGSNRFFAVQSASMEIAPGELVVLTGKSGSGKTTLLHMLSGVLAPDKGQVLWDGRDLYSMKEEELARFCSLHMAVIPQGAYLLPHLTVMENLLLPAGIAEPRRLPDAEKKGLELLERMKIRELADVAAGELSGGERRRACVARALASGQEVVFADEPTSDLDDENTRIVLELLRDTARAGASVLIVSHDNETLRYADRIFQMNSGKMTPLRQSLY